MDDCLLIFLFFCFIIIIIDNINSIKLISIEGYDELKLDNQLNIYGEPLQICGMDPITGWKRDGYCNTNNNDHGTHTVCARVNDEFLDYTTSKGNDLITPIGSFTGLRDGDNWCLCALRYKQAIYDNKQPPIFLDSTNEKTLKYLDIEDLENNSIKK
tara:strand:- start:201 stop:671 length:471 start_codon:yes stop_codon:yes gene_type:complete